MNKRHTSTKSDWITPPWLLDASRLVLGSIDLDPASSAQANKIVKAAKFFTERQNGLASDWGKGAKTPISVWLNPPGGKTDSGQSNTKAWWDKFLSEWRQPYFGHGLFLAFSIEAVQTTQLKCNYALLDFPTCFFKRRVAFINAETGKKAAGMTHSSCVVYLAGEIDRTEKFVEVFGEFGSVTRRVEKAA